MENLVTSRRGFLGACLGAAAVSYGGSAHAQDARPNIVLIMADDLGYGDPGCYNAKSDVPTPNIDRIAKEGMRFTDAHSPSAVCTPTRYGLLTGRYCWRSELKSGVTWGDSPSLIEPGRITVASMLRGQGYRTACVGKWHLGLGTGDGPDYTKRLTQGPLNHGFDYFFGIPASLDMPPYVYVENDRATAPPTEYTPGERDGHGKFWREGPIAPDLEIDEVLPTMRDKAVGVIDDWAKDDRPFFLYFPLTAPHTPWMPTGDAVGRSEAGDYGDFVTQVDGVVGDVLAALDRQGIADNTLIIMTSDNGAHETLMPKEFEHDPNDPWRGQKADIWEGGHRVPFVVRWPDKIPAGSTSDQLVCLTDFTATFMDMLDADLPPFVAQDSYSFAQAIGVSKRKMPMRKSIVMHSIAGVFAIREDDWKLIFAKGSAGFGWRAERAAEQPGPPGQLYNLADDPGEKNNLYEKHPEIVKKLTAKLQEYIDSGRSRPA